jgi:hypothetical protein
MRQWILSGILGVTIIILMGGAAATALWPDHAIAAGVHSLHGSFSGSHERHAGGNHCGHLDNKHTRMLAAYLEISLDLTEDQQTALDPVIVVLDDWRVATQLACSNLNLDTAPAVLNDIEIILGDAQAAVVALRPAFDMFYASLTQAQQTQLNSLIHHGHHAEES